MTKVFSILSIFALFLASIFFFGKSVYADKAVHKDFDKKISFTVYLHGIGNGGDNKNASPSASQPPIPVHTSRQITFSFFLDETTPIVTKNTIMTYDITNGNFTGSIDAHDVKTGNYTLTIKEKGFLEKTISYTRNSEEDNTIPPVYLVNGDINNDNKLDIMDYQILMSCFDNITDTASCTDKTAADLNDDGMVNELDYNLFLRELSGLTL